MTNANEPAEMQILDAGGLPRTTDETDKWKFVPRRQVGQSKPNHAVRDGSALQPALQSCQRTSMSDGWIQRCAYHKSHFCRSRDCCLVEVGCLLGWQLWGYVCTSMLDALWRTVVSLLCCCPSIKREIQLLSAVQMCQECAKYRRSM